MVWFTFPERKRDSDLDSAFNRDNIGSKTARGGALVIATQFSSYAIQIGSTAVLARLLVPADFGLIAMAASITALASGVRSFGLGTAVVQRERITHGQLSAIFWVNVVLVGLLALFISGLSPVVSWFFDDSRLIGITLGLALALFIGGATGQHMALMHRHMRWGAASVLEITSALMGPAVAIVAAVLGAGYWALVLLVLARSVSLSLGAIVVSGWLPGFHLRGNGIRSALAFGGNVSAVNLLTVLAGNIDNILLGRLSGATVLGFYSRAYGLLVLPMNRIASPITITMVPSLSKLRDDPAGYRKHFYGGVAALVSLVAPIIVFSAVSADDLVLFILGSGWEDVSLLFRLLAPTAFMILAISTTRWAYYSIGHVSRLTRWSLISTAIHIAAISIGAQWGAEGVAIAVSSAQTLLFLPNLITCFHGTVLNLREYFAALFRPMVAVTVAGLLAHLAGMQVGAAHYLVELGVEGGVFATLYLGVWVGLPGGRSQVQAVKSLFGRHISSGQTV